jgi:phosphoglycolate phosphatase-like HAD superfamily hydrolase
MKKVILLDVDGVLVSPGGYRAALHATLNYFAGLMGAPHFDFHEEKIAELEKRGIFSEWDMVPVLLGAAWNDILAKVGNENLPSDLKSAAIEIGRRMNGYMPRDLIIPDFEILPNVYPTESALQHGCFPHLPDELRRNLLHDSRNVHFSQTTRLFQHFSLGSRVFSEAYNLPAEVETESFLQTRDTSNLTNETLAKLLQPHIHLASITARPSAPPKDVTTSHIGYAPEAEAALELVGLADIPLIGYGRLEYYEKQFGVAAASLLKPSPVQSLAAVAAAFTGAEWSSIQAAAEWQATGRLNSIFSSLPREFELIVVEDTMGGIRSAQAAGAVLIQNGFGVITHTLGLTSGSASKIEAFRKADVPHFENWESLIAGAGL